MNKREDEATLDQPASSLEDATPRSALFRAVWRWHFYAGLLAIPIIVVLVLSGIVYLFRPQIDALLYADMRNVEKRGEMVPYSQQLQAVQDAYPDAQVVRIGTPPSDTRATEFDLDTGKPYPGFASGNYTAYVDPYTGEVLGRRDNSRNPAQIAVQLHGSLMTAKWLGSDKWGDRLIELVASWTVVLVVTGIYLWWPRGRSARSLKGVLVPRLNSSSSRIKWRDIHAVTGVLFSFIFIFFLLTGLAWTGVWGGNYEKIATEVGSTSPPAVAEGVPSQSLEEAYGEGAVPWGSSSLPTLPSADHSQHGSSGGLLTWDPSAGAPLDAIVARGQEYGFEPGFAVLPPEDELGSYVIVQGPDLDPNPSSSSFDQAYLYVDQYSAEPLADYDFDDYGIMAQATTLGISLHEGREWGLFSQLLSLAGALAVLLSAATSVVMWYKRRPRGLGAPRRVYSRSALAGLVAITFTLGVVFPLVGISLVALLAFDFLVLQKVPPLARALGAA